jgi:ribosome-binding protein aMBF1 (putative translation factor)
MKTRNKAENYSSPEMDEILNEISPTELKRTRNRMLVAAKIDDAIISKGWKKTDFAHKIGKNPSEITKWLSGTHNFTVDTLSDIESVLQIQLLNIGNPDPIYKTYFISVKSELQKDSRSKLPSQVPDSANESLFFYQKSKVLSSMDLTLTN